ncbi:MAG TPA: diacylglycerol kinase [Candidatus Binatia bacterium]|nr:diacylglycerol kinase [Candidatus Binatia bacterium]
MSAAVVTLVRRIWLATCYSWQGLRAGWRTQAALRYEFSLSLIVIPVALWIGRSAVERSLLIGSWLFVIVVELINSALETVVDRIGSDLHELSGRAKDLGSAAVFCSIVLTVTIWLILLLDRWAQ